MSIVLWAQEVVLLMLGLYWTVRDRYMQELYLGRALRTKETLPDFLKWRRVTRHPLVFCGLTGSQRTPEFWGVTSYLHIKHVVNAQHGIRVEVSTIRDLPRQPPEGIKPESHRQATLSTSQGHNP